MIINEDRFFLSHRTRIATMAQEKGWDVTLVTKDTGQRNEIEALGIDFIDLPINPTGMNPKDEIKLFKFFRKLFKQYPESIIHLVGLKNMMWGGIAAKVVKTNGVLFAVSGLGTLFGENKNFLLSNTIQSLLSFGMHRKNGAVIFQNHDDEQLFLKNGILGDCDINFIKGSGVALEKYKGGERRGKKPVRIIFTARMLREKGAEDLIDAAELLRDKYEKKIEFILCGGLSSNPNALNAEYLNNAVDGKYIKWLGHCNNIPELLADADIMCFPSYYREGVPKSLLEASAAGLPIITTDSVGCRDTVEFGKNGLLVQPHSPRQIADAIEILVEQPEMRKAMGEYSRKKAEEEYDVESVAIKHIEIYERLLNARNKSAG